MTWKQKQDHLWAQIIEDDTFGQYYASELPTESVITSFDDEWDVMPNGRHKVIHSVGAICQFDDTATHQMIFGVKRGINVC